MSDNLIISVNPYFIERIISYAVLDLDGAIESSLIDAVVDRTDGAFDYKFNSDWWIAKTHDAERLYKSVPYGDYKSKKGLLLGHYWDFDLLTDGRVDKSSYSYYRSGAYNASDKTIEIRTLSGLDLFLESSYKLEQLIKSKLADILADVDLDNFTNGDFTLVVKNILSDSEIKSMLEDIFELPADWLEVEFSKQRILPQFNVAVNSNVFAKMLSIALGIYPKKDLDRAYLRFFLDEQSNDFLGYSADKDYRLRFSEHGISRVTKSVFYGEYKDYYDDAVYTFRRRGKLPSSFTNYPSTALLFKPGTYDKDTKSIEVSEFSCIDKSYKQLVALCDLLIY